MGLLVKPLTRINWKLEGRTKAGKEGGTKLACRPTVDTLLWGLQFPTLPLPNRDLGAEDKSQLVQSTDRVLEPKLHGGVAQALCTHKHDEVATTGSRYSENDLLLVDPTQTKGEAVDHEYNCRINVDTGGKAESILGET
jgi:hypothetical protein